MPQMQDEAGNIWEVDAQGNLLGLAQAASPQQGRIFNLAPSPQEQRDEARQASADARADRAEQRARDAEDRRQREWDATHHPDGSPKAAPDPQATAKQRAEWRSNLANIGQLEQTIAGLRKQYEDHFRGKGLQSIAESWAPVGFAPEYGVFDDTAMSMLADMAKAKGLTAQQFNTPAEQRMFFEPLIPKRSDTDEQIEAKLTNLERMIASGRSTTEANLREFGADNEAAAKAPVGDGAGAGANGGGGTPPAGGSPRGRAQTSVAEGDTKTTFDARTSSQIDSLINAGASKAMVDAVLKQQSLPAVTPAEWNAIQSWRKQNPGKRYFGANISRTEDLSFLEKAAATPAAAFISQAGDAATAGILGAVAGEQGQGALDAMGKLNPNASFLGKIGGGAIGAAGAEAALAARAPAALAQYAPRIADALYGGLSGFNSANEGEGLQSAALGAGAGVLGGVLGERGVRAVGAATRGVTDPAVRYLRDRGIPLTVGETVGDAGFMGRTIKGVEDALTSVPGVGNMIENRRREGIEAFNRAAFQDAAAPGAQITATGGQGMNQVRQSVQDAYRRALDPVTINANDPDFITDLTDTIRAAQGVPNVNSAQDAAMSALQARVAGAVDPVNDTISGRGFQEAYRGLARTGRERASSDYGHEVGQVMRQGQDALAGALERQNPGAFDAFVEANAANRRASVLADALKNAGNQADELITPAQLNRADITSTSRLTSKVNSAAGNRPFYELARAGQQVLPSRLPDSGTAKRAIVGALTTGTLGGSGMLLGGGEGAAYGTGGGLALSLALGLGGTRQGQRLLTAALTERPDIIPRVASQIENNPAIGNAIRRLAGGGGTSMAAYLNSLTATP